MCKPRPESEDRAWVVEVTAMFHDTVLDVRQLSSGRATSYSIGDDPQATMQVPQGLPSPLFPLVHGTDQAFALHWFDGMEGEVVAGDRRWAMADMAQHAETRRTILGYEWPLARGAQCRVSLGPNTFLVRSVPRAEPVAGQIFSAGSRDDHVYNGLSALAHALVLLLVFSAPPWVRKRSPDLESRSLVAMIRPPPQDEELPEWIARPVEAPAVDRSAPTVHRGSRHRAPARPMDAEQARMRALVVARGAGLIGILDRASPGIRALFDKDPAIGEEARAALERLTGEAGPESYAPGGLGFGPLGGGGGTSGSGTIGWGGYGTIGPRGDPPSSGRDWVATTKGLARQPRVPDAGGGTTTVRGALDKEIIRRVIRRHINEVRYCYERELTADPSLAGRIAVQFTISGVGQVVTSVVQSSTVGNPAVEMCIANAVKRWIFPRPEGGGVVMVTYPFLLRAAGE